jgi:hypothetical protein
MHAKVSVVPCGDLELFTGLPASELAGYFRSSRFAGLSKCLARFEVSRHHIEISGSIATLLMTRAARDVRVQIDLYRNKTSIHSPLGAGVKCIWQHDANAFQNQI